MGGLIDLPSGLFRFLLDLWLYLRVTFFALVDYFTQTSINLGGEQISLLSVFVSSGILLYFGVAITKWVIGIIF